jgi:Cys-rich four helix bundle protein (predicted Tat secretion target)
MNRRDAMTALGGAAAFALASPALAQGKGGGSPKSAPIDTKALAAAARACTDAADECIEHCIAMLSNGDKSMAECFASVRQMRPVCETLEELAKLNSPHLKAYAAVCARVCRDCEKACKPHADQMAPCKACMDACAKCAAACEKV